MTLPTTENGLHSIDDVSRLKPLPILALKLSNECRQAQASMIRIVELIESDPALSARILAAANSPIYGYPRKIGSIQRAAIVLGLRNLSSLAISLSSKEVFSGDVALVQEHQLVLEHSLGCAAIGRLLAAKTRKADPDTAFLAGILHDIGKIALLSRGGSDYIDHCLNDGLSNPLENEQKWFGAQHADIGKRYVVKMGLPPELGRSIANHHGTTPSTEGLDGIVALANQLAKAWVGGKSVHGVEPSDYGEIEGDAVTCFEAMRCNFLD